MLPLVAALAGLTATLATYAWLARARESERYLRYANLPATSTTPALCTSLLTRLGPLLNRCVPATHLERVRAELRAAGLYSPLAMHLYLATQLGLGAGGLLLGQLLGGSNALFLSVALATAGALLAPAWLSQQARYRRGAIDAALPDALDMLTACVEAGLGLDAAIAQVAARPARSARALNQELLRYLQDLQMGASRPEALKILGARAGVEDLRAVVGALLQGDALGVGVAQILRSQAGYLRLRRKQRAEERAMKAPIKILFPLLFGIFPALFVVLLGPAMLRVWDSLLGQR